MDEGMKLQVTKWWAKWCRPVLERDGNFSREDL